MGLQHRTCPYDALFQVLPIWKGLLLTHHSPLGWLMTLTFTSQTVPAKMLNLNPGLKDITHSITGGSITAQG